MSDALSKKAKKAADALIKEQAKLLKKMEESELEPLDIPNSEESS